MLRKGDLTQGGITGTLLHFTLPMLVGSFLQQCYNIADTLIVGQCIGAGALAAVGSAYTLMVFLISVLLGLAMGSGTVFSLHYGAGNHVALCRSIFSSFVLIDELIVNSPTPPEKLAGLPSGNAFTLMVSLGVTMFFFTST